MSKSVIQRDEMMSLEVVHGNAAGIDIGDATHYVTVPPDRDAEPARTFEGFTEDLNKMADWLAQRGIVTVATQSTGVYWPPVYEILVQRGLEVFLVNARHTKNLPGNKSEVQECQWLMKLHLRTPEQLLPPQRGDLRVADVLATTGRAREVGQRVHPADAESVDGDECADRQREY